jgi:hypothetical protein
VLVDHLESAKNPAVSSYQGNAKEGLCTEMEFFIDGTVDDTLIFIDVDTLGLSCAYNMTDNTAIVSDPQFTAFDAQSRSADQSVVGPVPQKDTGPLARQKPGCCLRHALQKYIRLQCGLPLCDDA